MLAELATLVFVADIVNTAYFNATGFLGTNNENLDRGTLDAVPAGFEGLDISSVEAASPAAVKYLTFSFINP